MKNSLRSASEKESSSAELLPERYQYRWPEGDLNDDSRWRLQLSGQYFARDLPESDSELLADSRWPALFPCALCLVTTGTNGETAMEKVVGASIVNRFPYIVALSFCRDNLSDRHHSRSQFMEMLERAGCAVVQFLPPGTALDRAMDSILIHSDADTGARIERTNLAVRAAEGIEAPVFVDAYLAYEAKLVSPGRDLNGAEIFPQPWTDIGSHRVYFLEISAIQLRQDIAEGRSQIMWRSLPVWHPQTELPLRQPTSRCQRSAPKYEKGYTPHYLFPSGGTIAYSPDYLKANMAIKLLPRQPLNELRALSDDDARGPCFFPSSLGMISSWADNGIPNLMPCGSTTVVSRHPLVISICVSYADINIRYAPRASLDIIRKAGFFGCGVAFINDAIINAIRYSGNTSIDSDVEKLANTGLTVREDMKVPFLPALPIQFQCRVISEQLLGTHCMILGEVERIFVRADVRRENPLEWYPWAGIISRDE